MHLMDNFFFNKFIAIGKPIKPVPIKAIRFILMINVIKIILSSAPACWTIAGLFAQHSCWTFSCELLDIFAGFSSRHSTSLLQPRSVREGEPVTGLQFEPSPGLLDDCSAFLFCTLAGHFRVSCWASSLENFRAGTLALPLHPRSVREGEPVTGL